MPSGSKAAPKVLGAAADLVAASGACLGKPREAITAAAEQVAGDPGRAHGPLAALAVDVSGGQSPRSVHGVIDAWAESTSPEDQAKRMRRLARRLEQRRRAGR